MSWHVELVMTREHALELMNAVCAGVSAWHWWYGRRMFRRQMAAHVARRLRRGFSDAYHESWMRPRRDRTWWIAMLAVLPTDLIVLWGRLHGH